MTIQQETFSDNFPIS